VADSKLADRLQLVIEKGLNRHTPHGKPVQVRQVESSPSE
jgi:hypothetical protein